MPTPQRIVFAAAFAMAFADPGACQTRTAPGARPVRVYVLLGQSNMVGFGRIDGADQEGTLEHLCRRQGRYPGLLREDGSWAVRDDVWCVKTTVGQKQGWLAPGVKGVTKMLSPSVQLFLNEDAVFMYDMTEQILSQDSVHEGNVSPPPYLGEFPGLREEMLRQAGEAGQWLHAQGYRGTASADLLLVEREGKSMPEAYICEINARVTGATYPSVLARHFTPNGAWLLRNIRLKEPASGERLLAKFRDPHHLYLPGRHVGVLPINFNFGADGLIHKGQFLCLAPTPQHCHELLELAKMNLRMEWKYERD